MKSEYNNKPGYSSPGTEILHSTVEKVNEYVSISTLNIQDFIEISMKDYVPADYRTAREIDLAVSEPFLRYCAPEEISRVAKARSLKRQAEWLCGRIALKELLHAEIFPGSNYNEIVIDYDSTGRPFIPGHENIGISVSHSGEVAMAALHRIPGNRIGIDVEKTGDIDMDAILSVAFSAEERGLYKNKSLKEIISAFTMKEAYLKVTGQGFHEVITRVLVKDCKILFDGYEVKGLKTVTRSYKNEYLITIIYEL